MSAFTSVMQANTIELARSSKNFDSNVRVIDDGTLITLKFFRGSPYPALQVEIYEYNGLKGASFKTYKGITLRSAKYISPEYDITEFLKKYLKQLKTIVMERG
jgi:hypothetical protein